MNLYLFGLKFHDIMKRLSFLFFTMLLIAISITASCQSVNNQDMLRGSITPQRAWWDLNHYDLSVTVDPETQSISGKNTVTYTVLRKHNQLQIDLQEPMQLSKAVQDGEELEMKRQGDVYFISLKAKQKEGTLQSIDLYWEGKPIIARRPPWDGGFTWSTDSNGKLFIATSNQGIGSSVWWPNKDHPADEVDSLDMHVTVPKNLVDVSNGRLVGIDLSLIHI